MANRCPSARRLGTSVLNAHRFQIDGRGVATVVPDVERVVYGVTWEITESDLASLDRYEAVPKFYIRGLCDIVSIVGIEPMVVFFSSDTSVGIPRRNYLEKIVFAAEENKLPDSYIEEIKSWMNAESL